MRNPSFAITLFVAYGMFMPPIEAGVVTYTDFSSWSAAGPVGGTLTFSSLSTGNYTSPLTVPPILFSALVGTSLGVLNTYGPGTGNYIYTLGSVQLTSQTSGTIYGYAFNVGCYACSGTGVPSITITDANSGSYTYNGFSTPTYFAFRSDIAVASVVVTYPGNYVALDDVSYGGQASGGGGGTPPPSDTPEAGTIIMIGTGLLACARYRKFAIGSPQATV